MTTLIFLLVTAYCATFITRVVVENDTTFAGCAKGAFCWSLTGILFALAGIITALGGIASVLEALGEWLSRVLDRLEETA